MVKFLPSVSNRKSIITENERASLGKINRDDLDGVTSVGLATYKTFFFDYYGGWKFLFWLMVTVMIFTRVRVKNDFLIGVWTQQSS
jgi:hypothetical protein